MDCEFCNEKTAMPFKCGYCGRLFCNQHRLPENHSCEGLREHVEKLRKYKNYSDNIEAPIRENDDESDFRFKTIKRERRSKGNRFDSFSNFFKGLFSLLGPLIKSSASLTILTIMFLTGIVQFIAFLILGSEYYIMNNFDTFLYFLAPSPATILTRPWTLLTSIFTHGDFIHLFVNAIVFFFLGPILELRIGRKKFTILFLTAGVLAGATQLLVTPSPVIILGASGAILGVLGALTALAPRLPVLLFFFIPMPLWMLTLGYGVISALFATSGAGGIAHMAHLTGLLVGVIYGYTLRRQSDSSRQLKRIIRRYHY